MADRIHFGGTEDAGQARATRRRERAQAEHRPDPAAERMAAQLKADPDEFDRVYGAKGRIAVGLYESAAGRAGTGTDPREAA